MLPIEKHKKEILEALSGNQTLIVVGETGSGKTTKLPVIAREALLPTSSICITQPRRLAAISVAEYVADQTGTEVGRNVGYHIRFDNQTSSQTTTVFATEGILLGEIQRDPLLRQYDMVIVDEAHERNIRIEMLLGLLKLAQRERPKLKVVISSATINSDLFSTYFDSAPVVEVPGRTHPVEIVWRNEDLDNRSILQKIIDTVSEIHETKDEGDILIFLPGVREIDFVLRGMRSLELKDLYPVIAHRELSPADQKKVFEKFPGRKVVIATNIAETSITIDGIVYVIDSGLIKQTNFDGQSRMQSLEIVEHSQAGCQQRAGRAGRTQPGICFRMFSSENFRGRPEEIRPEIHRRNLAELVLKMTSMGIKDVRQFDFLEKPDVSAVNEAYKTLFALGAISSEGKLTDVGREMADLPMEPQIARMVLSAKKKGYIFEAVTIAAFLSARKVFNRPKGKEGLADEKHEQFKSPLSDALTLLKLWNHLARNDFSSAWCFENFINAGTVWEVRRIRRQILALFGEHGDSELYLGEDEVLKPLATGLAYNLCVRTRGGGYKGVNKEMGEVFLHPRSSVFEQKPLPRWIVVADVVETTKAFGRFVTTVKPEWLPDIASDNFFWGNQEVLPGEPQEGLVSVEQEICWGHPDRSCVVERVTRELPIDEVGSSH